MSALASVLPFLAALKRSVPDAIDVGQEQDTFPEQGDSNPSAIAKLRQPYPGPPAPDGTMPQGPPATPQQGPTPDLSAGMNPAPQQQMPTGPGDQAASLAGSAAQGQTAPKFQETKGHLLLRLLQGGLMGGLAGVEQNAQTYAQTGRNAGFGGGVTGAIQLPFMQAYQRGQLAQQQAQTELLKQQAQEINVPGYGSMPAGLAKVLFPSLIRGTATTTAATTRAGATTQAAQTEAQARIQAARMGLGPDADVPQDLQDSMGLPAKLPLRMLNQAESAANKPLTTIAGANDTYIVNKQTNQKTPTGVGSGRLAAVMARPVQVAADPNNPGNITYQSAGQAMQQGSAAPSSAPTQTARATAKAVAPGGKVGEEVNAFNTAIQHADLLQTAAEALHNGDQQTINSLKNRFSNEFGATGPITANTIAQAYTREISKMLTSGHMTDAEIGSVGSTLDPNRQSLPQMQAVIGAYKALAASKMQVRQQGVQQGMQGKPNFPAAGPTATGPNGHKITFVNGKWVDAASGQPIQ